MNNNINYNYTYYTDYINYLHSTNNIIQQNINFLQNNCYNLHRLTQYYLYSQNNYYNNLLSNNIHTFNYPIDNTRNQNNIEISDNTNNNDSNYTQNNINFSNTDNDENNSQNIDSNYLSNILQQIYNEIRVMENENIYNYILDNCITYSKFNEIEDPMNEECPINQTEFAEYDNVIIINNCNHIFNTDAIKQWFKSNHTCPVCRNNLLENTDYQPQNSYQFRF